MKAGTILFAGTDLGQWGAVTFTMSKTPEPAPPARATHRRVDISIRLTLEAAMSATAWAKARALDALLAARPEGTLEIRDENGTALSWKAVAGESSLPEAIARGKGRAEIRFSAIEPVAAEAFAVSMSIDPLDGEGPRILHRVTSWNLRVAPSRPDSLSGHRTEIGTAITFAARTSYADPSATLTARIDSLLAEQARIEGLASKEAVLEFADYSRTVQIESLTAKPSEGWEYLEVEGQARANMLPGESEAEIQFTSDSTHDPATGETRTVLSGTIRAAEKITAEAKMDALIAAWRTPARRVTKIQKTDDWIDGQDAMDPEWLGLKFQIELTQGSEDARYTLKIDTREAEDGARTVYSGTVFSDSLVTLLATVESAAGGKHPVEIRSELSIEYATDDEGTLKLSGGSFTREYATAAGKIRGTVERGTAKGRFGEWTATLNGTITAATMGIARTVARSLIPAGVLLRTDDEREGAATHGSAADGSDRTEQASALQFSYAWGTDHTGTDISYKDNTVPNYTTMTQTRTISGTCWAVDKTTAAAQVTLLLSALGVSNPTEISLTHSHERSGNSGSATDRWLAFEFSYGKVSSISGVIGHDIIEAEWEIERTGMVDHRPITEIPNSKPVAQGAFGYNIGKLVATGQVKARQQITARSWGQAKRIAVANHNGHAGAEDAPVEGMRQTMVPFSGTEIAVHQFRFTYSFRYADGLTGLWSSGLTL